MWVCEDGGADALELQHDEDQPNDTQRPHQDHEEPERLARNI